jgi:hypothetical protein
MKLIFSISLTMLLLSCSYRPIFSPNTKFERVGQEQANYDADLCMDEAKDYLKASKKRRAAKEGVRGAGMGAIFGTIFGILTGDTDAIIKSAAVGAGVGATTRAGSVLAEDKLTPGQIKRER